MIIITFLLKIIAAVIILFIMIALMLNIACDMHEKEIYDKASRAVGTVQYEETVIYNRLFRLQKYSVYYVTFRVNGVAYSDWLKMKRRYMAGDTLQVRYVKLKNGSIVLVNDLAKKRLQKWFVIMCAAVFVAGCAYAVRRN